MKKNLALFVVMAWCATTNVAVGAVTIKKAAPVATQEASATSTVSSLVPSVMGLVSGVQSLSAQQRELDAQCIPSNAEIEFVNNVIKEWAKTGTATWEQVSTKLNQVPCTDNNSYANQVALYAGTDSTILCYDTFDTAADSVMVWYKFPRASKATYCPDGSRNCPKEQKTVSNIYEIFDLVDFGVSDYSRQEATMAAKLLSRAEECSNTRLSKKKKEMWGSFLVDTIGSVGQSTNTSQIMQTVGNISQSGSGFGGLSSLGSIASQFLDK